MRRRQKNLGDVLASLVVGCFAYAALLFMQQQTFFKYAAGTTATVVQPGGAFRGPNSIVPVEFIWKDTPVTARVKAHFHYDEGQAVRIAYKPAHPLDARIAEPLDAYIEAIAMFLLGLLVVAVYIGRRVRLARARREILG